MAEPQQILDAYGADMRRRRVARLQLKLEVLNDLCAELEVTGPEHAHKKARNERHQVALELANLQ